MRRAIRCNSILSPETQEFKFKSQTLRYISNHLRATETSCVHSTDMLSSYKVETAKVIANSSLCSIHLLCFRQPEEQKSNFYLLLQP